METVSHLSPQDLSRPRNSKVCVCPFHYRTSLYLVDTVNNHHHNYYGLFVVILLNYYFSLSLGVPSAPGQVVATTVTDTSVLIQWAPPKEPNNLIGYYIDQCVKGSKDWTSANHKPHKSTRLAFSRTEIHCIALKHVCLRSLICLIHISVFVF